MALVDSLVPAIQSKFEVFDWRNALAILRTVHVAEWNEIVSVLSDFELRLSDLSKKGKGNKSEMAGVLDSGLYRYGWVEKKFNTRILVDDRERVTPTHEVD
ncbi:MAG: BglII/BstYI family type II restriction endonuclease [Hyphomicrobium sp.]